MHHNHRVCPNIVSLGALDYEDWDDLHHMRRYTYIHTQGSRRCFLNASREPILEHCFGYRGEFVFSIPILDQVQAAPNNHWQLFGMAGNGAPPAPTPPPPPAVRSHIDRILLSTHPPDPVCRMCCSTSPHAYIPHPPMVVCLLCFFRCLDGEACLGLDSNSRRG